MGVTRSLSGLAAGLAAAMVIGTQALAACGAADDLIRAVRGGDGAAPPLAGLADTPASCGTSLAARGIAAHHCALAFDYRDPAAARVFAAIADRLATCRDVGEESGDRPVNHPDSYALRRFRYGGTTVTLSLKDKAAAGRTHVFVRVTGAAPAR